MSELARNSDPPQSHEAADWIIPKLGTRRHQALTLLLDNIGEWVDAARFNTERTGGPMSGTRRVRELRASGWPIDIRHYRGGTWQYRMRREFDVVPASALPLISPTLEGATA